MTLNIADPSADIREEIAVRSGTAEPLNKIWFHKTASAVIDADRCIRCGACIAACPSQSLTGAEDGLPRARVSGEGPPIFPPNIRAT